MDIRDIKKLKVGLVLAGGGTRGFGHIGVLKAFEEAGIKFDFVAGTSVGSLVGGAIANRKTADEIYDIAKTLRVRDIRTAKFPFFLTADTSGIEHIAKKVVGEITEFSELPIPFACVATCLNNGRIHVFEKGNVAKAICASCAVPGIFEPVEIDGKYYVDGGVLNNLPADVARSKGCDVIIGVDIANLKMGTDSHKTVDVLFAVLNILLKQNTIVHSNLCDVVIRPNLTKFKQTSLDGSVDMYEEGYKAAKKKMPEILDLIKGTKPNKQRIKADIIEFKKRMKDEKRKAKESQRSQA